MRDLIDEFELAPETQALIGPLAVVGGQVAPSTPGTPFNLMMRPLSLASLAAGGADDPRLIAAARLDRPAGRRHGRDHRRLVGEPARAWRRGHGRQAGGAPSCSSDGEVRGVVTSEWRANTKRRSWSPRSARAITVTSLLDDTPIWGEPQAQDEAQAACAAAPSRSCSRSTACRASRARGPTKTAALLSRRSSASRPRLDYLEAGAHRHAAGPAVATSR